MTNSYIAIIGAMKEEVDLLKDWMDIEDTFKLAISSGFIGKLEDKPVILIESGIGKVNSSVITALLLEKYDIRLVINTGVAGALSENLKVTDMVISDSVIYHDANAVEFGYELGQVPGMPRKYIADKGLSTLAEQAVKTLNHVSGHLGLVVSGDSFIGSTDKKEEILKEFKNALAVDMESTSIAQACYLFSVPFVIIRSISDRADGLADMTYDEFLSQACVHSSEVVKLVVREL